MADDQRYDVVIIGTGCRRWDARTPAGHATASKVLWLERGIIPAAGTRQLAQQGGVRPRQVPGT